MRKPSPPGGGGGISPLLLSAPVALAGLLLSLGAGCSGGCGRLDVAWSDDIGLYRLAEPAVAFTNTVTGAHFEAPGRADAEEEGRE